LLHFIDVSGTEGRDPVKDYQVINDELKDYSEKLSHRTQIIVANKSDIAQDDDNYKKLADIAEKNGQKIFKISAATGEGVEELMNYVSKTLKELPKEDLIDVATPSEGEKVYRLETKKEPFTISKEKGVWIVKGEEVDRIIRKVNITDYESLFFLHRKLNELGLDKALKKAGIHDGDTVKIGNYEMEWED